MIRPSRKACNQRGQPANTCSKRSRSLGFIGAAALAAAMATQTNAHAQSFEDLRTPGSPLVLEATGSFYVDGYPAKESAAEIGLYGAGPLVVDQMYVQYLIPEHAKKPAVVMIHGATLSGKTFETTPDGRMGWYEYFARKGYPSYVVDQVERARSGFNPAPFNDVRAGVTPHESQPNLRRLSSAIAWVRFRIGPSAGVKFDDTQYPVAAQEELAKQGVPDLADTPASNHANAQALADLAGKLKDTVLMGHSQGGRFPFDAALLGTAGMKGLIAIEPATCNATVYSDEQITKFSKIPILLVFGDHLDTPQRYGVHWDQTFDDCKAFIGRINAAKGDAIMLHPADLGIHGNTHMIMQDQNNLQIADLIMKWIDKHCK